MTNLSRSLSMVWGFVLLLIGVVMILTLVSIIINIIVYEIENMKLNHQIKKLMKNSKK